VRCHISAADERPDLFFFQTDAGRVHEIPQRFRPASSDFPELRQPWQRGMSKPRESAGRIRGAAASLHKKETF
jgi:hypothetical protein